MNQNAKNIKNKTVDCTEMFDFSGLKWQKTKQEVKLRIFMISTFYMEKLTKFTTA